MVIADVGYESVDGLPFLVIFDVDRTSADERDVDFGVDMSAGADHVANPTRVWVHPQVAGIPRGRGWVKMLGEVKGVVE